MRYSNDETIMTAARSITEATVMRFVDGRYLTDTGLDAGLDRIRVQERRQTCTEFPEHFRTEGFRIVLLHPCEVVRTQLRVHLGCTRDPDQCLGIVLRVVAT